MTGSKKSRAQKRAEERLERVAAVGETLAATGRKINRDPTLLTIVRSLRAVLPGDGRVADPLELASERQPKAVDRMLSEISTEHPGVLGEAGLGTLQVWKSVSEAQGRGRGRTDLAIVFTDLVEFSDWALAAGDGPAVELLRDVSVAIEPPVKSHNGTVVKRLGDGMMAVFKEPGAAIEAIREGRERLHEIDVEGYEPKIRAGVHVGRPRKVKGDYFGVDVNIAARVAESAGPEDLLISDAALAAATEDEVKLTVEERPILDAKGVPEDFKVYAVTG